MKSGMKIASVAVLAILFMATIAAIVLSDTSEAYEGAVDAEGNVLTFDSVPITIASTAPSITETLIALGYEDLIIGVSSNCDDEGLLSEVADGTVIQLGSYNNPSSELLLNISADVIFIGDYNTKTLATYESLLDAGVPIVMLYKGDSLDEVYLNIQIICQVMNDLSNSQNLQQRMIQAFNNVSDLVEDSEESPKVMLNIGFGSGLSKVYAAGVNTFADDMLDLAGCDNIMSSVVGWKTISDELLQDDDTNPDIILVSWSSVTVDEDFYNQQLAILAADPIWGNTTAVQNGDVYFFYGSAATIGQRASPNLVQFSQLVLMYTHPELFDGLDLSDYAYMGDDYTDLLDLYW